MSLHRNSKGEWLVRWRQGNVNKSKLIGPKHLAERFEAKMKEQKRIGGLDLLSEGEMRFEEFVPIFWEGHYRSLSASTKETRSNYIEKRLLPRWAGYRLREITPPRVREWQIEMIADHVGAATQSKLLSILSLIFNEAELQGKVPVGANPVAPIKRPSQKPQHRPDAFPPERVEEIRKVFIEEGDLAAATFTSVAAYAGARPPHEILAITRADVSDTAIILRPDKGNATEPRSTRLLEPLRDDLRAFQRESEVAVGRLFNWSPGRYRSYRERLQDDFDLPRVYDLRHAFVTLLLQEGRNFTYVARQLGHNPATCISTYTHLEHLSDAEVDAEDAIWLARAKAFGSQSVRQTAPNPSTSEHLADKIPAIGEARSRT